jgi:hypothetical protein
MSINDSTNAAYSRILDTVHDSEVLKGLVANGVLPRTLRIIKAQADATDGISVANGNALLDVQTGQQVHLNPGEQILFFSAKGVTTLVGAGATFDFGLAAAQGSAVTTVLGTAATTLAAVNTGVNTIPAAAAVTVVGSADVWLAFDLNVAALTDGVLQCVIIVV